MKKLLIILFLKKYSLLPYTLLLCSFLYNNFSTYGGVSFYRSPSVGLNNTTIATPYKILITDEAGCADSSFILVNVKDDHTNFTCNNWLKLSNNSSVAKIGDLGCPTLEGSLTGKITCKGQNPLLTFNATNGQGPYKLTYTNGTKTFVQENVLSGVPFTVAETVKDNTYYSLVAITDANDCSTNISNTTLGANLIKNGDFSNGNIGFSSQYKYSGSGLPDGVYYVGNNPASWHPNMPACHDHTTGSGNMMLVNGSTTPNVDVWQQTITVKPNTNYVFSCWLQTITNNNPASLQFSINNIPLGSIFDANSQSCIWDRFYTTWNSGNNTTATISIKNMNTIYDGNDFALDDFSFSENITSNEQTLVTVKECSFPTAGFTAPDTVCVNTPVNIVNTSTASTSYYWSFCSGDLGGTVIADNIGNPSYYLRGPVFSDFVKVNGMFYLFVVNNHAGTLTRLDFGNNLLNTPTAVDLGNFGKLQMHLEGIQIVNSNGKWYALLVGGDSDYGTTPQLYKIEFGTSITNTSPIITTYPNIGGLAQPVDLYVFKDQANFYGLTINAKNNTITKFDFSDDLDNTPTAVNLSNIGYLNYPTGINAISVNDKWYVYITNEYNNSITRLDYGNSLSNTPTVINIGNPGNQLYKPRDIYIMQTCDKLIGFVNNGDNNYNSITRLDFNNDPESIPSAADLGNFGNFDFPHSFSKIFREGNDLYCFVTNARNHTITRIKFPGCNNANIPNSTSPTPPIITYSVPGTYNIYLTIDEGLPTQSSFCKSIVVVEGEKKFLGDDISTCNKSYTIDATKPNAKSYLWNNGATTSSITVSQSGTYWVNIDIDGMPCPSKDTINVNFTTCAIPGFTAPDSVCVNTPVNIVNTSTTGSSYYWNFSVADINSTPIGENLGNISGELSWPVFIDIVSDNGNYYGFLTNNYGGNLIRFDFGNSMLNTPVAKDLGNFGVLPVTYGLEGIQVIKSNGKWYAFLVGGATVVGNSGRIVKIEFGTNITNNSPVATNWGNIGNLEQPLDLNIFQDNGGKWYGFTVNADNNTVTRFDFGNDFTNPPTATNLGGFNGLLDYPTGINAINENGKWYVFITNTTSSTLTRLDFGNSLSNTPVAVNLGNPSNVLNQPRDLLILRFCGQLIGFIVNGKDPNRPSSNDLTKLDFNNLITNVPTGVSMGNIANFEFPHSLSKIFREGSDLYTFIPNARNNTLSRLKFSGSTDVNIPNSSLHTPPTITYSKPGIYNINLLVDEGLPTQSSFCKSIVVLPSPLPQPVLDTFLCRGDSVKLEVNFPYGKYIWNTGNTDTAIFAKAAGNYYVEYDYYGCKGKDEFKTTVKESPIVELGLDTSICKNDSLLLNAGDNSIKYNWLSGEQTKTIWAKNAGKYIVAVTNADNCTNKDSINIYSLPLPVISLTDDIIVCTGNPVQLNASAPNAIKYEWNTSPTLSSTTIANPVATPVDTTKYFVKISDNNNCANTDSVTVFTIAPPAVSIMNDTTICEGSSIVLQTQSASVKMFEWSPAATLNNKSIASPTATPHTKTTYTLKAANDGCFTTNNITIDLLPLPTITKSNDTTICIPGSAQLMVSGGIKYNWYPAKGLSGTTISNPVATTDETTFYKTQVTDANGCSNLDSILVKVLPKPAFFISPGSPEICIGDSVSLNASGGDLVLWQPMQDIITSGNTNSAIVYPSATTNYTATITNIACNFTDDVTAQVKVNPLPVINIQKSGDIDCSHPRVSLSASGGIEYNWWPANFLTDPSAISPIASVLSNTQFYVKVTDRNSCSAIDSIMVNVTTDGESLFVVPNAFSPNGDGQNDCFNIRHWGVNNELIDFSIYNRWGLKIFSTTKMSDCWDGTYKGQNQPAGGYVYIIHAKTICGDIERKGMVMLIR